MSAKNSLGGKPRGGMFPRTIGQCVDRVTKPVLKKQGAAESRLLTHWPNIVGAALAQYTAPQKIVFPRDATSGATLVLTVHSGWALEVQHQEPLILERIATFFGYRAVVKISIRQGYLDQPERKPFTETTTQKTPLDAATQQTIAEIADPDLRAALMSLGQAIPKPLASKLSSRKT